VEEGYPRVKIRECEQYEPRGSHTVWSNHLNLMRQAGNKWNHLHAMPLGASKMDKPPTKDPTGGSTDKERTRQGARLIRRGPDRGLD